MHRHPHFNLWLHHSDELAVHIGAAIREQVTLHEWPLSCVQRIQLAKGVVGLSGFLLVRWLTAAKNTWPPDVKVYDGMIVGAALKMESLFG